MKNKNYKKDESGRTIIQRPRTPREMKLPRYGLKVEDGKDVIVIPEPRSLNEVPVTEQSKGSMSSNEKDTLTFPLATASSCIRALRSIYGYIPQKIQAEIRELLKH